MKQDRLRLVVGQLKLVKKIVARQRALMPDGWARDQHARILKLFEESLLLLEKQELALREEAISKTLRRVRERRPVQSSLH